MGAPRMLVLEDDRLSRQATERLFRKKGWDVVAVSTVADGLEHLAPRPDCVLVDLMLPGGDGEEFLEALAQRRCHPCVVVLTAIDDPDRHKALRDRYAPTAIFLKPVDVPAIMAVCDSVHRECSAHAVLPAGIPVA